MQSQVIYLKSKLMTDEGSADNSEIVFSIRFLVLVYFVWSWPFTLFGLAVNNVNRREGEPLDFPFLSPLGSEGINEYLFFPIATSVDLFILLWILRFVLPLRFKQKLVWDGTSIYKKDEPIKNTKPAICSALLTLTGIAVLIFAAFHIRSDRTHRQPVIIWEGPAADYFEWFLVLGWTLSYLGCVAGVMAEYFTSRWNWLRYFGMMGFGIFPLSFIIYCGLYED